MLWSSEAHSLNALEIMDDKMSTKKRVRFNNYISPYKIEWSRFIFALVFQTDIQLE